VPIAAIVEDALKQELMKVSVRQVLQQNAQWLRLTADSEQAHNVVVIDIRHKFDGFFKLFSKYDDNNRVQTRECNCHEHGFLSAEKFQAGTRILPLVMNPSVFNNRISNSLISGSASQYYE
jgi:hypothetical protein